MTEFDTEMVFRIIGVVGFGLYVANYTLLSSRVVNSDSARFFFVNTLAAAFVLASNYIEFNLASVMIQIFWIAIGIKAMIIRRRYVKRMQMG
ncbi:MAG: hypothetical protein HKN27_06820 [Silicimonas sp.]|nr:hypothetical protein [Silicimonas sp.]